MHGALAVDKFSAESIAAVKSMLFGETEEISFHGRPLNKLAEKEQHLQATITGGNLTLVQTSLGTDWQIDARNKIIFLEEIGERGYKLDRMLAQLTQAHIFDTAVAIIFGDCLEGKEPKGSSLVQPVLERFAQDCPLPVLQIAGIGHGPTNFPLPLGTEAHLYLGKINRLLCSRY